MAGILLLVIAKDRVAPRRAHRRPILQIRCGLFFGFFGTELASSHFEAGQKLDIALIAADVGFADARVLLRAMSNAGGSSAAPTRSIAKAGTMAARAKMQARIIWSPGELGGCINDTPSSARPASYSN
jgi:hypothetical protein